ncbi:response regulator [Maridesulfovibrio sp.]|uniref:response regulator n=1 Tax=Maridesulfovibrio sp. TaxID=2795000 RepID=UPI002A18CC64|nr:response regulator [Maridesulfovibrio sp.]
MVADISCMKILIAEDSRPVRLVLKTYINQMGIEPEFAETGNEAYEKLQSATYDLIILDIHMPGMDGREIIRRIRGEGIATPAMAMTAEDDSPILSECLKEGFTSFLLKPILKEELFHIIFKIHKTMD